MFAGCDPSARERFGLRALIAVVAFMFAACAGTGSPTGTPAAGAKTTLPPGGGGATPGGVAATPGLTLPPGVPSFSLATLTFKVALTGATPISGDISETVAPAFPQANRACSDVTFDDIAFKQTVAGHNLVLTAVAVDPKQTSGTIALDLGSSLAIDTGEDGVFAPTDTSSKIQVNTDGTGHLDLAGWINATGATESGTITWTCRP